MNNIKVYNERMSKGMEDKLFFLDKIPAFSVVVDFGCANGDLIKTMNEIGYNQEGMKYIGYDYSQEMLDLAEHNLSTLPNHKDITLTKCWVDIQNTMDNYVWKDCTKILILSSVIHEVYSYSSTEEVKDFWDEVFNTGFDYIIIRDMLPYDSIWDEGLNVPTYDNLKKKICSTKLGTKQFNDYDELWGNSMKKGGMVHFLLKYKYIENWERELAENYFACTLDEILNKVFKNNKYHIEYLKSFTLPYFYDWVLNEMNYVIDENTHAKLILKRK